MIVVDITIIKTEYNIYIYYINVPSVHFYIILPHLISSFTIVL